MLVPFVLSTLLQRCAPGVGPVTMRAIVVYESGDHPFAIGDNTDRRSYFPRSSVAAARLTRALIRRGHDVDLGYAQINASNLVPYGLTVSAAFDPCTNLATGSKILRAAYAGARRRFGPGRTALVHALSAYNGGSTYASMAYARAIYATAFRLRRRERAGLVARRT